MIFRCKHNIIWQVDNFYGVYPRIERGVCIKCGKQFKKLKIQVKGGVSDGKNKTDAK
jgi:hypothetical protein